jgi:hypothetical protein
MAVTVHDVHTALAELGKLRFGEMRVPALTATPGPSPAGPGSAGNDDFHSRKVMAAGVAV